MTKQLQTTRDGFGLGLLQAAQLDEKIVGVCADLTESTKMHWFAKHFPERFFQVGVAEQNLVGVAAGLALGGLTPFAASYACFSPANSWGVIRTTVCYNDTNVKIVGGHAGLATGADGATHQALEDIAIMRVLPNMTVVVPADGEEARKATIALALHKGPAYLRTSKHAAANITTESSPFTIGTANTLREGSDATIIGCGHILSEALKAAELLTEKKISVRVINMHTIKPLDEKAVLAAAKETHHLFTLEDHQIIGGLGGAVAEYLSTLSSHPPLTKFGMCDAFGQSGSATELLEANNLNAQAIAKRIETSISNRATLE